MNTDNGALSFESSMDNEKLIQSINEAEKRVKGFAENAAKEGEKIDDVFKVTAENIRIQKDVIGQLEGQIANLKVEISKLPDGSQGQIELKKQAQQLTAELNAEKVALKQIEQQVKETETAHVSYRTQLRQLRDEMIAMEAAGKRDSDAYRELQVRAGELKDAIADAQAQMTVMADDERMFKGIVSTIGGFTGAMSAAQGAVGLFAGENENLNKIMLKVQSLMAITIGLQQVAEMLNKDSYFSVVVLTKAKEMLAVAEMKFATALGVSTVAARVLMATLTLGLSIAITAIVVLISKMSSKAAEARKQMEEFNKSVAESAVKPIAILQELSMQWDKLGNNLKAKEQFIQDNADKFKDLGVSVKGVNDAEKILVERKQEFVDAIIARSKALAAAQMASEKYKEALIKDQELGKTSEYETTFVATGGGMGYGGTQLQEIRVKNSDYTDLKEERDKLNKEGDDLIKASIEFKDKEVKIIDELGVAGNKLVEGSITALEDLISKKKAKYKEAASDKERSDLSKEIKALEANLERMDKLTKKDDSKEKTEKANKKIVDDFEAQMQDEIKMADSVLEVLAIIEKKKKELKNDGSDVDKGKKGAIDKEAKSAALRVKDETDKLLTDYATYLTNKVKLQKQYNDDMILLQQELDKATSPEEKTAVKGAMNKRTEKFNKDMKSSGSSEYDALLEQYRNFEEKKQAITEEYDTKRAEAQAFGNEELIKRLDEAQAKAMSSLATEELTGSDVWNNLFNNLDDLAARDIDTLIKEIEAKFDSLSVKFDPIDLQTVRTKLEQARNILVKDNPFKQVGISIKKIFNDGANDAKRSATEIKKDWNDLAEATEGAFNFVTDAINSADFLKEAIGELGATAIASMQTVAMTAIMVATAIKTAERASVILAIIQAVLAVVQAVMNVVKSIIASHDKGIEKSIKKHQQNVEDLKKAYDKLDAAIEKALGSAQYSGQTGLIDNLKQQQKEYYAMAEEESKKKKASKGKIADYKEQAAAISEQIAEVVNGVREDILGGTVKDIANELGNAMIDAFTAGEDAAVAWGDKVDEVVGNVIKKMLVQKLVEEPVGNIINKYMSKWVDGNGNFLGFDSVMSSAASMGKELSALGPGLSTMMENLPDSIKKYLVGDDTTTSTAMSGAIQGVSEETASVLSGQINAMRIIQIESQSILKEQLANLAEIAFNTRYLKSIDSKISSLSTGDSLRSQGL